MENTYIDIRLEGDNFSPLKLKNMTNLPIEIIAEKGAIGQKGYYKGKPYPFGIALIKVDGKDANGFNSILSEYLAILLSDDRRALKQSGVEEIVVDVETPAHQGAKFSFNEKLIEEISNLNARIEFQTIEDDNLPLSLIERSYKSLHNEAPGKFSKKEVDELKKILKRFELKYNIKSHTKNNIGGTKKNRMNAPHKNPIKKHLHPNRTHSDHVRKEKQATPSTSLS